MEENGEEVELPPSMTEAEILEIVRELLGDDEMPDEDLLVAYRSGLFQELCPDIAKYARQKESRNQNQNTCDYGNAKSPSVSLEDRANQKRKSEVKAIQPQPGPSRLVENFAGESKKKKVVIKYMSLTESSDSSYSSDSRSSHNKKKKKKRSDTIQEKSRQERRENIKATDHGDKIKIQTKINKELQSDSDSEDDKNDRKHREEKCKKYTKKRNRIISCEDDSDGSSTSSDRKMKQKRNSTSAKNHLDKVTRQSFQSHQAPKPGAVVEKTKELKPFSKYNRSVSKTNINRWRPILDNHHMRYQQKFKLKTGSIICIDLLDLPIMFHHPRLPPITPNAVPLKGHVTLSKNKIKMINRLETEKVVSFKAKLKRRASRFMKQQRSANTRDSFADSRTQTSKRAKIINPIASGRTPIKKPENKGRANVSKCNREAEARKRKLEEVKKKAEKIALNGTRKLPQKNKPECSKKGNAAKEKEKANMAKKKRAAELLKLKKDKKTLTIVQSILAKIDAANKAEAMKPKVVLEIPKLANSQPPKIIHKVDGKITVGGIASEVTRLLSSNTKVECPVVPGPDNNKALGKYTVEKIAWWLLKNEIDPAPVGRHHPELHDNEDAESSIEDDIKWPSDESSVNGCVSDPEGTFADAPLDPSKVHDEDWRDEYCGLACLVDGNVRKPNPSLKNLEIFSEEYFWSVFTLGRGTNYDKPTFKARCRLCSEVITGQRQLGAHVRSESHKDKFRNHTLKLAKYEEEIKPAAPKKEFVAKLVKYYVNDLNPLEKSVTEMPEKTEHDVGIITPVLSDSPGPLIGGKVAFAHDAVDVHEMPLPDPVSLPDIEDYDLSSDESLQQVKVAIRTKNKWNNDLERSWRQWNNEQVNIAKKYNGDREFFIKNPEEHPKYREEWLKFWSRRSIELEAEGVNTDTHHFPTEWMSVWLKRVQEILKEEAEYQVAARKRAYGIDKHTLRQRFGISAEASKRKTNKKMKNGEEIEDSRVKTFSRVASISVVQQQQMPSFPTSSGMELQPNCLPTPPVTSAENRSSSYKHRDHGHHRNDDRRRRGYYDRDRYSSEGSQNEYHKRDKYHRDDNRKYEGHGDRYRSDERRRHDGKERDRSYNERKGKDLWER